MRDCGGGEVEGGGGEGFGRLAAFGGRGGLRGGGGRWGVEVEEGPRGGGEGEEEA